MGESSRFVAGSVFARRQVIPFRTVNRKGQVGYDPNLQRHHLLPLQLLSTHCFGKMFYSLDCRKIGFDDFRANGLLLPSSEEATLRIGLPLHRGPHRQYNAMVIERVGQIEANWSRISAHDPASAQRDAHFRLSLLQSALRKRLLYERRRLILNRKDPLGTGFDFAELDAMAEALWRAT